MVDSDARILELSAASSAHAHREAIRHINEEIAARDVTNLTALVDSLAPDGPYAYTILPQVRPDGSVSLPVLTSREEIHDAYRMIRGMSELHQVVGLTEVRGAWYLFQDSLTVGAPKGTPLNRRQTLGLFPSGVGSGITGELVWMRLPRAKLGAPDEVDALTGDSLVDRENVYLGHLRFLDALRANDLDGVLDSVHPLGASAIRNYVGDDASLVELSGPDAHRAWFGALLERYEFRSIEPLVQVTEDWYVFAELRIVVAPRTGGAELAFNTAEFHMVARDGRFIARIGHGTEPVPRG